MKIIGYWAAEGWGKGGSALALFRANAMGSTGELEHHLSPAQNLKLISAKEYEELAYRTTGLRRMLNALLHVLKADRS